MAGPGQSQVTVASLIEGWGKQTAVAAAGRQCWRSTIQRDQLPHLAGASPGLGEIAKGNSYGVLLHAMLAVDAQSGDSWAWWPARSDPTGPPSDRHDKRAASERESQRWLSTALAAKQVLSAASMVTVIGDRESDIYSAWAQIPEAKFHLLSRSMQDRALVGGGCLDATVAGFPIAARRRLDLVGA